MSNMPEGCPTSDQLKSLIDGALPESQQSTIQKHVDDCVRCQKALELLVAGSQSWDAVMDRLRDQPSPAEQTVLADAIRRMKADEFAEARAANSIAFNPADYLEPSAHPGSIGKLGAYEITEVIGQGGMGVVLKAFDPSLHRVVAVKVLAPYLAHNPQARRRFVREAKAIAAVCHDHVITIHGIDETTEQPKIVMQFVSGKSLQQKIDAEGSLDLKEILRIAMQTASGLAAAHAQGLVHRDVKPSNILLENGVQRVKLTDFGLARAVDDASLTQSGVIAGTPQYMAPEQANGDAVDYRADLFCLGSVMYAMCVGHSPFRASTTMGVLKRVCHDPPRPIQEINPDIPGWLCAIVMKLLQKKPEDRFSTAKDVAELLEKWLAHVQQPMAVSKPTSLGANSSALDVQSQSSTFAKNDTSAPLADSRSAARSIDGSTILFQTITWRSTLFFLLLGVAIAAGLHARRPLPQRDAISIAVVISLLTCFWGLLLLGIGRFLWANFFGYSSARFDGDPNHATDGMPIENGNQNQRLFRLMSPESLALLPAIFVMACGADFLIGALVAFVVWRIALARVAVAQNASVRTPGNSHWFGAPSSSRSQSAQSSWLNSVDDRIFGIWQSLRAGVGSVFDGSSVERSSTLIAIAWCIEGGIELLGLQAFSPSVLMVSLSFMLSLLAFGIALNIYLRQNLSFVRLASLIALIPLPPCLFGRIPLSIATLYWQSRPATKASFEPTPWPETQLGRWIYGPLRLLVTFGWLTAWSVGWLMALAAVAVLYVIPSGPSQYQVSDEAKVTLKGHPEAQFRLAAFGVGATRGLRPPTRDYQRQSVLLHALKTGDNHDLPLRFGGIVSNELTHRALTESDVERFFSSAFSDNYPSHAANLFDAIQRLNTNGGFAPQVLAVPPESWPTIAERISMTGDLLNRSEIDRTVPPPGFIELGSMLDPNLFLVDKGEFPSAYDCVVPGYILEFDIALVVVVWLLGIGLISRRRHFRRTSPRPVVHAIAS